MFCFINVMGESIKGMDRIKRLMPSLTSTLDIAAENVRDSLSIYDNEVALARIKGFYDIKTKPTMLVIAKDQHNEYHCLPFSQDKVKYFYEFVKHVEWRFEYDPETETFDHWNAVLQEDDWGSSRAEILDRQITIDIRGGDDNELDCTVSTSSTATIQHIKEALQRDIPALVESEFAIGYRGRKLGNDEVLSNCISTGERIPIFEIGRNPFIRPRQRSIAGGVKKG